MSGTGERRPVILLVEDNESIRHAFSILLEESGYRVLQAGSGGEALAAASGEGPDLVLLDLGLPDIGGLEVARRLRADPGTRGIVVVALTGRALESDQQACMDAGCAGFLPKPVDALHLLRSLPEFLAKGG